MSPQADTETTMSQDVVILKRVARTLAVVALVLIVIMGVLEVQIARRNRALDKVEGDLARVEAASLRAQTASEAAQATLQAAIDNARAQGGNTTAAIQAIYDIQRQVNELATRPAAGG